MARIGVLRQGYFSLDPRVRSEVEALVEAGHRVDVICLRRPNESRYERKGALTIRRLSVPRDRGGLLRYVLQYGAFMTLAGLIVGVRHLRRRYDLIQVNTIPDSLVFAALIPKLCGARVVLDLHECMPEFLATKFGLPSAHPVVRLVTRIERVSIRFADFAFTCTEPMRQTFIARGAPPEKLAVILCSFGLGVDPAAATIPRETPGRPFTLICHGTIEERYGLDTLVHAVALAQSEIPSLRLLIYGEGSDRPRIMSLVHQLGLEGRVSFSKGWVPLEELVTAIRSADVGVVAIKRDPYRDLTLCHKMFDYVSLRTPAIVSRTRAVEDYFDESCFGLFTAGDPADLARAIRELYQQPALRRRLAEHAAEVSKPYFWSQHREGYRRIVEAVAATGRAPELPAPLALESTSRQPSG
jgi:glycosyltransferase involved in cell wall biosynthesis